MGYVAYEAYRVTTGGKSLASGARLPSWTNLPEEIRAAWRAAADAVLEYEATMAALAETSGEPRPSDWPEGPQGPGVNTR